MDVWNGRINSTVRGAYTVLACKTLLAQAIRINRLVSQTLSNNFDLFLNARWSTVFMKRSNIFVASIVGLQSITSMCICVCPSYKYLNLVIVLKIIPKTCSVNQSINNKKIVIFTWLWQTKNKKAFTNWWNKNLPYEVSENSDKNEWGCGVSSQVCMCVLFVFVFVFVCIVCLRVNACVRASEYFGSLVGFVVWLVYFCTIYVFIWILALAANGSFRKCLRSSFIQCENNAIDFYWKHYS